MAAVVLEPLPRSGRSLYGIEVRCRTGGKGCPVTMQNSHSGHEPGAEDDRGIAVADGSERRADIARRALGVVANGLDSVAMILMLAGHHHTAILIRSIAWGLRTVARYITAYVLRIFGAAVDGMARHARVGLRRVCTAAQGAVHGVVAAVRPVFRRRR